MFVAFAIHPTDISHESEDLASIIEILEAAAIRYVELTMKCVHCHKYVRGVRMARLP